MKSNRPLFTVLAALAMAVLATSAFATKLSDLIQNTSGLVAYWQFDEPNGATIAKTTVPVPNPATDGCFSYTDAVTATLNKHDATGISGSAVTLATTGTPGADKYLNSQGGGPITTFQPGVSPNSGDGSFSVEFWAKSANYGGLQVTTQYNTGTTFSFDFQYNQAVLYLGANVLPTTAEPVAFAYNQWNFFVYTFTQNGDGGTISLYLNGQPDGSLDITSGVAPGTRSAWANMIVWATNPANTELTQFDELAVFNRALSQQEILDQFNAVPEPGLLSLLALGGAFLVWRRKVAAKRA